MTLWRGELPAAEAERLAGLMAAAFTERGRGWSAAEIAALAVQPGVAVLAAPQGFAIARRAAGEAEILTLAVHPGARGGGIGHALLAALLDHLREAGGGRVFLEVAEGNVAARRLYARAGFTECGRRPGYAERPGGPPEDALVLALDLGGDGA